MSNSGRGDRRHPAGDAIHEQPASALTLPASTAARLVGQAIVEAVCALHDEKLIRDLVRRPDGELLQPGINEESANLDLRRLGFGPGRSPLHRRPFTEANDVGFRKSRGGRGQDRTKGDNQ